MTAYSSYIEHTMGDYIQTDEELKNMQMNYQKYKNI